MKAKNFMKKNLKWIILFICLITLLFLVEDVLEKEIMEGDIIGYNIVSKYLISDFTIPLVKGITKLGGPVFLISISTIIFIVIQDKEIGLCIWANLGIATILNQMLKHIFQRPRPTEYMIINEAGYSFPSGHSMVSMAFYGYLIYLIHKNVKNKYLKWGLIVLLSILIILIGLSRIYLGVHYTSDVLAGFLVAISYLIIFTNFLPKQITEEEKSSNKY